MRKLYARFVTHSLTPARREDPFTSCQDIITVDDADKNFFNNIITGDETRCFAYDLETKRQSSESVGEISPRLKKLKFQKVPYHVYVDKFFRLSRRSAPEFVPQEKTVNAEFYKRVMDHLKRI
jgi:hypothetical protein